MAEMLLKAGADVTMTCFDKTVEEHIRENIPGLDPSTIRKTRAPLANNGKSTEASSTFERLLEIVDTAGVSGKVSSGDLDEFKSILLEVDSAVLNRCEYYWSNRPHRRGEGGHGKADIVRGVARILYYKSDPNADKGGRGQKIRKFCGRHIWFLPSLVAPLWRPLVQSELQFLHFRSLPGGYTLLQRCSNDGLLELAEVLLKEGEVDPNGTTDSAAIPPVLMAANGGHRSVLELLSESGADFTLCTGDSKETVLHCLLKHGKKRHAADRGRYEAALDLVLAKEELRAQVARVVNRRDALKNTALHYATQMWSQETVRKLLEAGANIGMKNHFEEVRKYGGKDQAKPAKMPCLPGAHLQDPARHHGRLPRRVLPRRLPRRPPRGL